MRATDAAGSTGPEASRSFVVNVMPPADRDGAPDASDSCPDEPANTANGCPPANTAPKIGALKPALDSTTRNNTPLMGARATDEETDLTRSSVKLYLDGKPVEDFRYDSATDRLSYTPKKALKKGKHAVRIVATDAAGKTRSGASPSRCANGETRGASERGLEAVCGPETPLGSPTLPRTLVPDLQRGYRHKGEGGGRGSEGGSGGAEPRR